MNRLISGYIQKHYDIISFDIFDTLIERKVSRPSDIFRLTGEKVLGKAEAEEFCQKRILAERTAREGRNSQETDLDGIYENLLKEYGEQSVFLKEKEIQLEIEMCHRKEKVASFFEECCFCGKEVYLISDMYLPFSVISSMLNRCGIHGYQALYVSNVYGKNKLSGELFKIVLHENSIDPKKMIHIGDSMKADFSGAHKAGVKALLIGRKNRVGRLIRS